MLYIKNGYIKTMAGPDLENGCLLIEEGKIAAGGQAYITVVDGKIVYSAE